MILDILQKYEIKYLHYMAPIENAPSIIAHGILSYNETKRLNICFKDIALSGVQKRREGYIHGINHNQKIHDCVPLYFATCTAMQYNLTTPALSRGRIRVLDQNDLIFFEIDPVKVFALEKFYFTDQNAASNNVTYYTNLDYLSKLNWEIIWDNRKDGYRSSNWRSIKASEVLVPNYIPFDFIVKIVVFSEKARDDLEGFNKAYIKIIDRKGTRVDLSRYDESGFEKYKTLINIDNSYYFD